MSIASICWRCSGVHAEEYLTRPCARAFCRRRTKAEPRTVMRTDAISVFLCELRRAVPCAMVSTDSAAIVTPRHRFRQAKRSRQTVPARSPPQVGAQSDGAQPGVINSLPHAPNLPFRRAAITFPIIFSATSNSPHHETNHCINCC
jgi:hypothetical protein